MPPYNKYKRDIMTTRVFNADIQRLLQLIIKQLYKDNDIFLRELICNASDAIDKLRLETLNDPLHEDYSIEIIPVSETFELIIKDNGVGMNENDLIQNLSTIAHSGTEELRKKLSEETTADLIGQFGVGFFSAFLVADKISLNTKRWDHDTAYNWQSDGILEYAIQPITADWNHGTEIRLSLKPDYRSFLNPIVLKQTIEKYLQFISYPIHIQKNDNDTTDVEAIVQKIPLWKRQPSDCTEDDYIDLFRTISGVCQTPPYYKHFASDTGKYEFSGIFFINPQPSVYGPLTNKKIRIYSNNVLVMDSCPVELMPDWMNYVCGVIETNQVNLNVSRETFQNDESQTQLKKIIRKQMCALLSEFFSKKRTQYLDFYKSFSKHLKWAVNDDEPRLKHVLLWNHNQGTDMITLDEYIDSYSKPSEKHIFYLTGNSVEEMRSSIFLQPYQRSGKCVLLLDEPIDEFLMQRLQQYEGYHLTDISKEHGESDTENEDVIEKDFFKKIKDIVNDDDIQAVKFTTILDQDEAARVISSKSGWSGHMENVMRAQPLHEHRIFDMQKGKRIFEMNPDHPLVGKIRKTYEQNQNIPEDTIKIIYSLAMLRSGYQPRNLSEFSRVIYRKLIDDVSEDHGSDNST
jgi:molecular chaperone HtpG